jgi:hypothetical protein
LGEPEFWSTSGFAIISDLSSMIQERSAKKWLKADSALSKREFLVDSFAQRRTSCSRNLSFSPLVLSNF